MRPGAAGGVRRALALAVIAAGLGALVALAGPPDDAAAKRVRVFAVGPKFHLSWVETRARYRAKLLALMDRGQRGRVRAAVQPGAGDVASRLLGPADRRRPVRTARDLVALPEDLGLMAIFSGSRGAAARRASSLAEAIVAVLASYGDVSSHYAERFPALAQRPFPPTRLLFVSATDTFARTAVETFAELADRYDVYLEAGVNMAESWRVVCVDRERFRPPPGADRCDVEDPALVARLRAPDEPRRDYAYEATTDRASNLALLFDPNGRLVTRVAKAYPTPTEAPGLLDLRPGRLDGVRAVQTPVGRLGFVTSRDAFMPDVVHRLDQERVELLVQPEFFVNDIVRTQGMWSPDTLKASGYSAVQRLPSVKALVLPEMTGNVFDFSADAQQHIVVEPRGRRTPTLGLVGQEPAPGFVRVQSWHVPDPIRPGEPMTARRRRLGLAGERAAAGPPCARPTHVGPCRGGQVEGVLFRDVRVGERPRRRPRARRRNGPTPFAINRPIAPSRHAQRNVSLATRGRTVWAAFEQQDRIRLARSENGGRTWSRPSRPAGGGGREWWPALSVGPDATLWLAWQQGRRIRVARSIDGGRTFDTPRAVSGAGTQSIPSIAATEPNRAYVAWIDERLAFAGEQDLPQAALFGAAVEGPAIGPAVRLDGGEPADLARTQDHAWSPSVAARGDHLLVSWMDARTYDWRIYARESTDGGTTFGPERAVQDTPPVKTDPVLPPENEALNADPAAALGAGGPLVAFTDFRKTAASARRPHPLYDTILAAPEGPNRRVDGGGTSQVSSFWPALEVLPGGDALVAWQDMRAGPADVAIARVRGPGTAAATPGTAVRIDDTGTGAAGQWRPQLALSAGGRDVVAAWEDDRDGPVNVFAATARADRIR